MVYNWAVIDETVLKETVAKNIAYFRKKLNMTQLELAEKLNYSDKSISKWERAEALPDALVLKQLADMFHIKVDDLMSEKATEYRNITISIRKRIIIPAMSAILVFFLATVVFALLVWLSPVMRPWLCFIFAVPAASIVLLVFSAIAHHRPLITFFVSLIIWSTALTLFVLFYPNPQGYLVFIIGAPMQILTLLWHSLFSPARKTKNKE